MSERSVDVNNIYSADGVKIVDGLIVWDYDLKRGIVDLRDSRSESSIRYGWDGWFRVHHIDENGDRLYPDSNIGSLMNDVRVCVRDPRKWK